MKKKEFKKPILSVLELSDDIVLASDGGSGSGSGSCSCVGECAADGCSGCFGFSA